MVKTFHKKNIDLKSIFQFFSWKFWKNLFGMLYNRYKKERGLEGFSKKITKPFQKWNIFLSCLCPKNVHKKSSPKDDVLLMKDIVHVKKLKIFSNIMLIVWILFSKENDKAQVLIFS